MGSGKIIKKFKNHCPTLGGNYSLPAHLVFLIPFTDYEWYDSVYWTLAIEFQFYIFIGLFFHLINKKIAQIILITPILLFSKELLPSSLGLPSNLSYFLLGYYCFMYSINSLDKKEYTYLILSTFLISIYLQYDLLGLIFSIVICIIIGNPNKFKFLEKELFQFLGKISYSLYITHAVVLICSEIVIKRLIPIHTSELGCILLVGIYLLITIFISTIFEKNIERHCLKLSKRI